VSGLTGVESAMREEREYQFVGVGVFATAGDSWS